MATLVCACVIRKLGMMPQKGRRQSICESSSARFLLAERGPQRQGSLQARPPALHRAERGGAPGLGADHQAPEQDPGQGPGRRHGAGAAERAARHVRHGRPPPLLVSTATTL